MSISRAEKLRGSNNLLVRFMRFLGPWGLFFRGFLKHPVMVGSIIPSSPTLIRAMLKPVDWQNVKLFVEYGPGVGTFCRPVLERRSAERRVGNECVSTCRSWWCPII